MPDHRLRHDWDVTPAEARDIQQRLRGAVETRDRLGPVRRVAGVDVGIDRRRGVARAAVAVLDVDSLAPLETALAEAPLAFPYVPGLLSFREVPVVLRALDALARRPDLLLCDGQGYAHPRRVGLACHLGLLTDLPSVGVAKTRLIGTHGVVPEARGRWTPLLDGDETIGAVLRSRVGVKPLFVSIGHRVSLESAVAWTVRCTGRYRLPETTRTAHRLASGR